ncbi:FAD-binding oxidoreductase [Aureimonas ureilytica]|uniref:FAD-binding oxidoreductase n=1 Tax=Aureimonas ureilytica TaxID=401562 RepID=UPI00036358C6|nr:FAD-binding oxidoreductase [Aureimonas ureilytica]
MSVSRAKASVGQGPDGPLLDRLSSLLPAQALLVGDAIGAGYREDLRAKPSAVPRFVLRPGTTQEVAACLKLCDAAGQPLAVQGGRTGLSGGHRIVEGEAVLSTERMTELGAIEEAGATVLAAAGTPLQRVQEAAQAAGFLVGVDLGARGTATVGGNIATNAGGIRVLRYGMFRAQVAGLEAVLADGTVLSSLRGLAKDNTGYDLNQLFIGSEGTLGVVTRARLRLHPLPRREVAALLAVPSVEAGLALLHRLRAAFGSSLSAFEFMGAAIFEGILGFLGRAAPLETRAPIYILTEIQAFGEEGVVDGFEAALMAAIEDGVALDAVVSQSQREFASLWTIRDSGSDFVRTMDHIISGDVSVPVDRTAVFLEESQAAVRRIDPHTDFFLFGHMGDGNVHYVIRTPKGLEAMDAVYRCAAACGGSISAEHGIGFDKKPWLHLTRSEAEIEAMRRLKRAFDPNNILNPGRIFDRASPA